MPVIFPLMICIKFRSRRGPGERPTWTTSTNDAGKDRWEVFAPSFPRRPLESAHRSAADSRRYREICDRSATRREILQVDGLGFPFSIVDRSSTDVCLGFIFIARTPPRILRARINAIAKLGYFHQPPQRSMNSRRVLLNARSSGRAVSSTAVITRRLTA